MLKPLVSVVRDKEEKTFICCKCGKECVKVEKVKDGLVCLSCFLDMI